MARDVSAYLQDVLDACNSIEDVMSGVSLDEYRSKRAVRSAVEREFIIIGEALRRVSALDESLFVQYLTLVRSLISEICLLMIMEQLTTMRFSGWSTQT
jgi:hypothetical protein